MEKQQKEKEILIAVTETFMKFGVKSLTMDDISRKLGISKKTLYTYVSDKKDLVKKAIELAIEDDQCMLSDSIQVYDNAIDELIEINKKVSEKLQTVQPAVMYDLQKYYPEAWKIMDDHKKCFVKQMIADNIKSGIKQGLYRDNVNPDIISTIYIILINKIFDADSFSSFDHSFQEIHKEIVRYHVRGIASEKGIKHLTKQLKGNDHDF